MSREHQTIVSHHSDPTFQVLGFTQAMTNSKPPEESLSKARTVGFATFGAFVLTAAAGTGLGLGGHFPFLFGLGNLPTDWVQSLPFVTHAEPVNALSIPTWAIHFSSVFEYLFAMNLVWDFAESTKNSSWKGLTWGMLPLHASGICACTVSGIFQRLMYMSEQHAITIISHFQSCNKTTLMSAPVPFLLQSIGTAIPSHFSSRLDAPGQHYMHDCSISNCC